MVTVRNSNGRISSNGKHVKSNKASRTASKQARKASKPKPVSQDVDGVYVLGFFGSRDGKWVSMLEISLQPRDRFPAKMSRSAARKFMDVYNNDPTGLINLIEALANGAFDQPPADANVNSDRADYNHAGYRR